MSSDLVHGQVCLAARLTVEETKLQHVGYRHNQGLRQHQAAHKSIMVDNSQPWSIMVDHELQWLVMVDHDQSWLTAVDIGR